MAPLIALFLTFTAVHAPVHAAEDLRKVTVVSFGLFGDRFGAKRLAQRKLSKPIRRHYGEEFRHKTGGGATVEALAATLNAEAKKMNGERDILFSSLRRTAPPTVLLSRRDGELKRSNHPLSPRCSTKWACDIR